MLNEVKHLHGIAVSFFEMFRCAQHDTVFDGSASK